MARHTHAWGAWLKYFICPITTTPRTLSESGCYSSDCPANVPHVMCPARLAQGVILLGVYVAEAGMAAKACNVANGLRLHH